MRDWRANDATKCGIFGVWISDENIENPTGINTMCPGTDASTHWCCAMDMGALPLFYLFYAHGSTVLPELDAVCNRPPLDEAFPGGSRAFTIFAKQKVEALVKQIGRHYAVPRNEMAPSFIAQKAKLLNDLLHEFSPPQGDIPTAHNYVQVVDCSVALYAKMQAYATCADPKSLDSGPFCASYHLGLNTGGDINTNAAPAAQLRSSLYYYLPNTMLEFPFAWWHKCVLLQGRQLSTTTTQSEGDATVHCRQWKDDTILAEDMQAEGLYDDQDVRGTLLRVNGGVTSAVMKDAVGRLEEALLHALSNFTVSGSRDSRELEARDKLIAGNATLEKILPRSMLRIGAPADYNMKCYKMAFLPPTAQDFLTRGGATETDCALNMLMWVHNENANVSRYDSKNSFPELGRPGIQPECFVFREKDLASFSGPSYMVNVFTYLRDRFYGNASIFSPKSDSMARRGLQLTDFFDNTFNDGSKGLLVAEYVPPDLTGLPSKTPSFSFADGSVRTDSDAFVPYKDEVPCVTVKDIEAGDDKRLACLPLKDDPVPLEEEHCLDLYTRALADLTDYAQRIENVPTRDTSKRWPADKGLYCVWACGQDWEGYDQPAHAGLDKATLEEFKRRLEAWNQSCAEDARRKDGACLKQNATAVREAMLLAKRREYIQEVCGPYVDEVVKNIKDKPGLETFLGIISNGISDVAINYVNAKTRSEFSRIQSYLSDETAKGVKKYAYRCEKITVRSSGSTVVDRVREQLSFNDIVVSQNFEKMKEERSMCAKGTCRYNRFNDKLYQLITSSAIDTISHNCSIFTDRCIPEARKANQPARSKKINANFIWRAKDPNKECLTMAVVTGMLDCKFWLSDGLYADIQAIRPLANKALRSAVRKQAATWTVAESKMPGGDGVQHTTEFAEVLSDHACAWCVVD